MIENMILKYLKEDTVLAAYIDGKIYPNVGQVASLPCVIMSADGPTSPSNNPWDYTQNLTFEIYAKTEKAAQQIRDRFYDLLNKYDDFYLAGNGIIIREAHAVNASVSNFFPDETDTAKEKVVSFDFRFTKCA